jgi:antitoxin ParD1/3/4
MGKVAKISIALPPDMVSEVRSAVASGEYASASEVVRDALRDWRRKRQAAGAEIEEMRRLVREGIDSGPGRDVDQIFARLRAKYADMAKK